LTVSRATALLTTFFAAVRILLLLPVVVLDRLLLFFAGAVIFLLPGRWGWRRGVFPPLGRVGLHSHEGEGYEQETCDD